MIAGTQPLFSQENSITADQIISDYITAIGGPGKIAAITTFSERGEISGKLAAFGQLFGPPTGQGETATFEFYFKAPNLRSYLLYRPNGNVLTMRGCTGTLAWYIGRDGVRHEFKPTPEKEYECKPGYDPTPLAVREQNVRFSVKGKKKIRDRIAWVMRADDPKSASTDTYYFDAENYLLLRWETDSHVLASRGLTFSVDRMYSDYRDVGGLKLPFMIVQRGERSSLTSILQKVEINGPIEATRFEEPPIPGQPQKARIAPPETPSSAANSGNGTSTELTKSETPKPAAPLASPSLSISEASLVSANFVNSSIAELQQMVPELRSLKPASDQSSLPTLLDEIGDRTVELLRKMPNLISHEQITESLPGAKTTRENFSYLIVARKRPNAVTLEEFRVDLKTGAMLETDDAPGAPPTTESPAIPSDLMRRSQQVNTRTAGHPPLSQGFASMWLRFYPSNRSESNFRYLGEQKTDGHQTFVLAFAQKPGSVRLPGQVRYRDRSVTVYYQGVAWVDSNFRILRLRTDLLSPISDISLNQLTAEVHFAEEHVSGIASPLWLPHDVQITSLFNGHTFQDKHNYSSYRSYQVRSKILLTP